MTAISVYGARDQSDWRAEVRDAIRHPAVMVTIVIVAGMVVLAAIAAVAALAYYQRDATVMLSLVSLLMNGLLMRKVSEMDGRVRTVETQTNGNTSRLLDHALKKGDPA